MLTETDPRARAFVNVYAILGTLPELYRRVPAARELLAGLEKPVGVEFAVHGGPRATLVFAPSGIRFHPGRHAATIRLGFPTPARLNAVIDGRAQPLPVSGFTRLGFLTRTFVPLTELLTRYLRPSADDLADPAFREASTILTLYVAVAAVAQLAEHDRGGRFSAAHIPDGEIGVEVTGSLSVTLDVRDHHMTFLPGPAEHPRSRMVFSSLEVAGRLLAGEVSAMACICSGDIAMSGTVSMVDNVNRILDRAAQYLAD